MVSNHPIVILSGAPWVAAAVGMKPQLEAPHGGSARALHALTCASVEAPVKDQLPAAVLGGCGTAPLASGRRGRATRNAGEPTGP